MGMECVASPILQLEHGGAQQKMHVLTLSVPKRSVGQAFETSGSSDRFQADQGPQRGDNQMCFGLKIQRASYSLHLPPKVERSPCLRPKRRVGHA